MPLDPEPSDAWLLVALMYGKGNPSHTIGAADGLNHVIPTDEEWSHACAVLGERGLIESSEHFPRVTSLGEGIVKKVSTRKGIGLFRIAETALSEIKRAPLVGSPVDAPRKQLLDEAYRAYVSRSRRR